VDHLIILGTVSGIVTHAQTIKVEAGGILRGEWTTHSLEVAPGAILHGKSTMKEAEPKA
jgi:cytoskeletal protein CcmA (bactofilin family)